MELSRNEKIVFKLVRNRRGIVRSEISRLLKTSKSTAERIVQALIDKELILERVQEKERRGRGGIALSVNRNKYIICIELNINETLDCALISLDGDIKARSNHEINPDMTKEQILQVIDNEIFNIIKELKNKHECILGIGFGDPGIVDSKKGVNIFSSTFLNWRNVEIASILSNRFEMPVFVQDASRIKCLAEARYGVAQDADGFIYIDYGDGVGLGVYNDGVLYTGNQGFGCEIGHMVIDLKGPICGCGGRGCLEAIIGQKTIVNNAIEAINKGVKTIIKGRGIEGFADTTSLKASDIFEAAQYHDRLAINLIDSVLQSLGIAIGNVCNLFNPSLVVLGGEMPRFPSVWEPILPIIHHTVIPFISQSLEIKFSNLIHEGGVLGAGELVCENLFYPNRFDIK